MVSWKQSQFLYGIGVLLGAFVMTSCADSKDTTSSSFDMSEYRKMMERQKNQQAALDSAESTVPERTPEEQEQAGDAEAQRRNLPLASCITTKR